jgi:hypothetical protein
MFRANSSLPVTKRHRHGKVTHDTTNLQGRYSIGRTAAYREIRDGRLRITKVGRRTLVANVDAESWLSALRTASQRSKARDEAQRSGAEQEAE